MLEQLVNIDQNLFEYLNGWGNPFLDKFMLLMSSFWIWIPVYGIATWVLLKQPLKKALLAIGLIFISLILTDFISVYGFKEVFERLRPCYDANVTVRLVAKSCGGMYGFVSSHSSNAFGFVAIAGLLLRKNWFTWLVICWAVLVSFSRIYLGLHYPGDIVGGIILGLTIGSVCYFAFSRIIKISFFR